MQRNGTAKTYAKPLHQAAGIRTKRSAQAVRRKTGAMLHLFTQRWVSLLLVGVLLFASLGCTNGNSTFADAETTAPPTVLPAVTEQPAPPTVLPAATEQPVPQATETPAAKSEKPALPQMEAAAGQTPNAWTITDEPTQDPFADINLRDNEPSGVLEKRSDKAVIDYSNTSKGYVMAQRLTDGEHLYKIQVSKSGVTYTYNLPYGVWSAFTLSLGNGRYTVTVHENRSGSKYAQLLSVSFDVVLENEFEPFLRPSQYIDYMVALDAFLAIPEMKEAALTTDTLEKVDIVYRYVIENMRYDYVQAATVKSGYVPDLAKLISRKRGICFDFSSLMTSMLRILNVPCKMVFGYVGKTYHAWISVWTEEEGWVDAIFFDGKAWHRMDPTFASAGTSDETIASYVGNGKYYSEKYYY